MLKFNLRLIFRNFRKHRSSFLINIIGLSTGFACAILIFLWIQNEMQVDHFHRNDKQLFQVLENHEVNGAIKTQVWTPDLLAESLASEMGEVEMAVPVSPAILFGDFSLSSADNKTTKAMGQFAGVDFFKLFSFALLEGDPEQVLKGNNSVVISRRLAQSLFQSADNAIGKTIEWKLLNQKKVVTVTGVFENVPSNSTMQFDFVLSFGAWIALSESVGRRIHWGNNAPSTFLLLKKGTNLAAFNDKIANYLKSKGNIVHISLFAIPYSSQYLHDKFENGVQVGGRIDYVRLFSLVAIFILVIAGINFMNLATARASLRFREVGVKKVVGSGRFNLLTQFVSEAILISFFALILSVLLVLILLPLFNQLTEKQIALTFRWDFVLTLVATGTLLGALTGIYPALYLSKVRSSEILKGSRRHSAGELAIRKGLVVFQFAVSVVLIIGVIVVYQQVEFIKNRNLGYNKDNLIVFGKEGGVAENQEAFLAEARKIPGVVDASGIGSNLLGSFSSTYDVTWDGKEPDAMISFETVPVDYRMLETLEVKFAEGRSFSSAFGDEKSKVVINEAAVKVMGIEDPVGKTVRFWGEEKQIIGVVHDFNFESLREEIQPLLFRLEPAKTMEIMVRVEAVGQEQTLAALGKLYKQFNPGFSFDYQFMDGAYQKQYASEIRVGILSRYFAGLGILISCLGLFGLAAFAAEQRIKEIGIRKVNGAKISEVMTMLNKDFVKWVAISFVIATPIAYYATNKWLENFAYKTELSWWIFALAGVLALGIALLTVSWQSWRAATRNPVEALRYE